MPSADRLVLSTCCLLCCSCTYLLTELHVKMLEPNTQDDEANTLKQWVDQGTRQPAVLARPCNGCCAGLNVHTLWLPACHLLGSLSVIRVKQALTNTLLTALTCAGVMDSVSKGYLKNMYFGISQDAAGTNLLEVRASAQHLQLLLCALPGNCPCAQCAHGRHILCLQLCSAAASTQCDSQHT